MRKVVITAIDAISGNGDTVNTIFNNMAAGKAHRNKIDNFPIDQYPKSCKTRKEGLIHTVCASPLSNEKLAELLEVKADRYDRHQLFAMLVAQRVMDLLGEAVFACMPERFGIFGGTGDGGLTETYGATLKLDKDEPVDVSCNLRQLPNIFTGLIAQRHGLRGPGGVDVSACAASTKAIIAAVQTIQLDQADAALVVGTEAVINPFGIATFARQQAISNESRPYQAGRTGFLMGEGAAALLLESEENARPRGAPILAEVAGYGSTTDGNPKGAITAPDPSGGARSAVFAMQRAGINAEDIAHINTHGTGTPEGDKAELEGIKMWAGQRATKIPISSTKSFSGHLLGAAGAFELMLCVMMLQKNTMLPTHGLTPENIDPELANFNHVIGEPKPMTGDFVLSNSFGFGGANASIVLKRAP